MMKVRRVDHVALAVKDLEESEKLFCGRLGAKKILQKVREDMGYVVSYLEWGEDIVTLVQPITPECFINKHLGKYGEGLHHMGIEVENLGEAEKQVLATGGKIGPRETIAGVRSEFVLPPKYNNGLLLQVIEYTDTYKGPAPQRYQKLAQDGHL